MIYYQLDASLLSVSDSYYMYVALCADPARVEVLRRETARVRRQQQQQLQAGTTKVQVKVEKAA